MSKQLAKAKYDYSSTEMGDLNFKVGDVVEVTQMDDVSGWWVGRLNDQIGQFPGEYVELIAVQPRPAPAPPPRSSAATAGPRMTRVKILYDYEPGASDEVAVRAGETYDVIQSPDPGWWLVKLPNGAQGIFPKNYTEIVVVPPGGGGGESASNGPPRPMRSSSQAVLEAPATTSTSSEFYNPPPGAMPAPPPAEGKFSISNEFPIWRHPSYTGLVADRHINEFAFKTTLKDEFQALARSFAFMASVMKRVSVPAESAVGVQALIRGLDFGQWVAQNLPVGGFHAHQPNADVEPPPLTLSNDAAQPGDPSEPFHLFLYTFMQKVREMRKGDVLVLPGGWAAEARTRREGAPPPKRGFVAYVLGHRGDWFDFSIVNDPPLEESNEGSIGYHPATLDGVTGKTRRATFLTFENVPRFRLNDSSFWFMLFRMLVFPHECNGPAMLYQSILPYLNQVPLQAIQAVAAGRPLASSPSNPQFSTLGTRPRVFKTTGYRPGDSLSNVHLLKTAANCVLLHYAGLTPLQTKRVMLEMRRALCKMVAHDVGATHQLVGEEAILASLASNQLADAGAKFVDRCAEEPAGTPPPDTAFLSHVVSEVVALNAAIQAKAKPENVAAPPPLRPATETVAWASAFPMFGRFRRDTSVEELAGAQKVPSILRPVQLTLVPDSVSSFHDVAVAFRQCAYVCTLLDNQKEMIKNTYILRAALIQHLFTHVIPLPSARPETCFWQSPSRAMRYETQADLLRSLEVIGRHFVSSALSLRVTRSFDAVRIVTMACIATVADVVARKVASDVPSQFSLHLSGEAEGPVSAFGFEMGYFLEESGFLEFADPQMTVARTQILDYFFHQRTKLIVDESHVIFRFERSMNFGEGDARLVDQLCVQMGFPRDGDPALKLGAAGYLSGQDPLIMDNYPEFAMFRDIVFLFKSLLTPTASSLPSVKAWKATDARLTWIVKSPGASKAEAEKAAAAKKNVKRKEEKNEGDETTRDSSPTPPEEDALSPGDDPLRPIFQVSGFGVKALKCASFERSYVSKQETSGFRSFLGFFGLGGDTRPRAPPSGANPSNLAGTPVVTEDDVLHLKTLPDFGGRLGARDSELLLTYLTAPYIRIPLVIQFFAEQSRVTALAVYELQVVLDSCLFEPSLFQTEADAAGGAPDTVPVARREMLGTPTGLLFNELQRSPHVVLRALEDLLFYALELDVGRYSPTTSAVLLYISRLCVRVLAYLDFVCANARFLGEPNAMATGGARQRIRGVGGPEELSHEALKVLEKSRHRIRNKLTGAVFATFETWCDQAVKERDLQLACVLYAHMANVFAGTEEFDYRSAAVTLCAYVFLTVNFRFTAEIDPSLAKKQQQQAREEAEETLRRLGVPQVELFFFFQCHRHKLMRFFEKHPRDRDEIMEAVVRVVTLTGSHRRSSDQGDFAKFASGASAPPPVRTWQSMNRPHCVGRFMPDTEVAAFRAELEKIDRTRLDFEEWLRRVTTLAVDTEINVQLGEFTLKKNPMQLLPDEFFGFKDFQAVLGVYHPEKGEALQCAEVRNTTNRQWWRLVGHRHDVQLWTADVRTNVSIPFTRPYPGGLGAGEKWMQAILDPYRAVLLPNIDLFLPGKPAETAHFARLMGLIPPSSGHGIPPPSATRRSFFSYSLMSSSSSANTGPPAETAPLPPGTAVAPTIVEVVVFANPPTVHIYHIVEHGRRFYSTLAFTSDSSFTFADYSGAIPTANSAAAGSDVITTTTTTTTNNGASLTPPPSTTKRVDWTPDGIKLSAGRVANSALPPTPTLVITRNVSAEMGVQQYIPSAFLFGLLPHALLERYDFWQNADESLVGYPNKAQKGTDVETTRLQVELFKHKDADMTGYCNSVAYAVVRRITNAPGEPTRVETLLNPLYAEPGSALRAALSLFSRLDNLSHVLMWTRAPVSKPSDAVSVDSVELPRVRLGFKAGGGGDGRFFSDEHAGLFVTSRRDPATLRLIQGLTNCVLLENDQAELFAMVPAASRPTRPRLPEHVFPTELLLDRSNAAWLANLGGDVRHYLYPVHLSRSFLFTPTLSGAINLLLLRFANRMYADAFRLADACVSDTPLSPEERQAFEHLGAFNDDQSPDAHAVRLKISLATLGSRDTMRPPWNTSEEYYRYTRKFTKVSATCRLTMQDEAGLLGSGEIDATRLKNRVAILILMRGTAPEATTLPPIVYYDFPSFDAVQDMTALEDRETASSWKNTLRKLSSLKTIQYSRPDEVLGASAIRIFERAVRGGVNVRGNGGAIGFPFLYELMTGTLTLRILQDDSCYNWGCTLLRLMPPKKFSKQQTMTSILRILSNNPIMASQVEKYKDTRSHKISIMLKGQNDIQKLLVEVNKFLRSKRNEIVWPPTFEAAKFQSFCASFPILVSGLRPSLRRNRLFGTLLRVNDLSLSQRAFKIREFASPFVTPRGSAPPLGASQLDGLSFASRPLAVTEEFFMERTRQERGLQPLQPTVINIHAHPAARSRAAKAVLDRVEEDVANFVSDSNAAREPEMRTGADLARLRGVLENIIRSDAAAVDVALAFIVEQANAVGPPVASVPSTWGEQRPRETGGGGSPPTFSLRRESFLLARLASAEPTLWLELLFGTMMAETGDADVTRWNPFLTPADIAAIRDACAAVMFRMNRIHQAMRAIRTIKQASARDERERRLGNEALAREISAKRHYVSYDAQNQTLIYDPRFLVFEFTYGILLRDSQVALVKDFMGAMRRAEGARCHQMIMGSGKTTVVGPLLALLLGDGKSLVVQVVPAALLEFSRAVMRECFSSALIQKPVYTFSFDRVSSVTQLLVRKLKMARDARAVVCTHPTALKSFFLKLVEAAHILDNARVLRRGEEYDEGQGIRGVLAKSVFGFSRLRKKRALEENERAALMQQVRWGVEVIGLLREGALILDEVDLILHPLKSELNWPIGARLPLDFTYSSSRGVHGLRWHVPFHLLDAVLHAGGEGRCAWAADESREARVILEQLSMVVKEGLERRLLQRTPHLVLLSKMFYVAKMKPLLARWMVLFLVSKGVRGIKDDLLMNYLSQGPRKAHPEAVRAVREVLSDEHVKLVNLSHDWLDTFAPFCLSKIDRVKFGLLTKEDLERLLAIDPRMPKNRKLLAVPFVGKDVPSRASEFSHPDVQIGLSTLAYRYEGLRMSDFKVLIRVLREQIEEESGPYPKRPSGALFIKWVELAGGRVRGTRLEERRDAEIRSQLKQLGESSATLLQQQQHAPTSSPATATTGTGAGGSSSPASRFDDIWPLQLLDVNDDVQMDLVYELLGPLPHAALYYLDTFVFPETMQHQGLKLSACGQELGGSMLFKRRLGFSGTPSDLLPVELGVCHYERGSDGRMMHYLSDPEVVSLLRLSHDWGVTSLLDQLCAVEGGGKPIYNALIDTGALVTGMSNLGVAQYLLPRLPPAYMDGVVYLDSDDVKMVLTRAGKIIPLSRSGLDPSRRFSFYDQVHTTGMDIKQIPDARAALTLGKDMTFRDYAQGAFRMRGIGKGQTIELVVIPEVDMLIEVQIAAGRGVQLGGADLDAVLQRQRALPKGRIVPVSRAYLLDVVSWLVINACVTEKVQFNLLLEQSLSNVWRKRAFDRIAANALNPPTPGNNAADSSTLQPAYEVDVYRERIDYSVENTIPKQKTFLGKLDNMARENAKFFQGFTDDVGVVTMLLGQAREAETHAGGGGGGGGNPLNLPGANAGPPPISVVPVAGVEGDGSPDEVAKERAFNAEQVQEQEQEQEQQVEQEQEKEEERAEEDEQEEFVKKSYSRDDETPKPWRVDELALEAQPAPSTNFFPVSKFAVHKTVLGSIKPIAFPETMWMSRNMYDPRWTLKTHRRLKNVICLMEYAPSRAALKPAARAENAHLDPITLRPRPALDQARATHLQHAFAMFDASGHGQLDGTIALEVVKAMDVDPEHSDFAFLQKCFEYADADRSSTLNFAEFKSFVERRAFYAATTEGRYYVALSLQEAESLRAVLHASRPRPALGGAFVALHSLASRTVLDATPGYLPASEYQDEAFAQLYRFLDSEMSYEERAVGILVRALQENDPALREQWFEDVRECRRRSRRYKVRDRPVWRVLTVPHEYAALEYRATVTRVRELIYRRGMFSADAFRAFDSNRDGLVNCSELFGALFWLGLTRVTEDQVRDMMRALDKDKDGCLSMEEFKNAFGDPAREEAALRSGVRAPPLDLDSMSIPPRQMRELYEEEDTSAQHKAIEIPPEAFPMFRVKLKPPHDLSQVWSSKGSLSESDASIWAPDTESGMLSRNRVQVCSGYYANGKGFDKPTIGGGGGGGAGSWLNWGNSGKDAERTVIEIKDEGKWGISGTSPYMKHLVEVLMPHPIRFQQVWMQQRGSPIFAWRPIPPRKEFVAMGCVVTTTDDPPDVSSVRCVPRHWCVRASKPPTLEWKDAGASGGRKGSIWTVNGMGLCYVVEGHESPAGGAGAVEFWELKERAFHLSAQDLDICKGLANTAAQQQQQQVDSKGRPVGNVSSSSAAPASSVPPPPPEIELDDGGTRPSLDSFRYAAPPMQLPDVHRYPIHVFASVWGSKSGSSSSSGVTKDTRRVDVGGFVEPPPPDSIPLSKKKSLQASESVGIPPPPPVSGSHIPGQAPPPRPSKPSSAAMINTPTAMVTPPSVPPPPLPVATETAPPRPSKPSSQAALGTSSTMKTSASSATSLPASDASGGVVPPARPSKPSSQASLSTLTAAASSSAAGGGGGGGQSVPPPRPAKKSSEVLAAVGAVAPVTEGGAPPPRPSKPSSEVSGGIKRSLPEGAPPAPAHGVAKPAPPPLASTSSTSGGGDDELAKALARRKAMSESKQP